MRGVTPSPSGGYEMKEIKEMKEEDLIKMLNALREELNRRRAEVWERYTGVRYPMKNPLKKEAQGEDRRR